MPPYRNLHVGLSAQDGDKLAEVLLGQGLKLRARRAAEAALRLDPGNRAARAVVEASGE
jgi:hypothetical protein